ncbi:hypothetical protein O181_113029 [Austropuccinia psidii MF-1]|uniref:Reverse transcriptase Ty1/copia-type domain-containing protein n=1 Tax=Austropuccinia psidii MF-1 TaxID=1389203 RepID=A0A9Q3K2V8_9BASI|nr:hypothetical protein [Austropuccinia psidii MF-1]
MESINCHSPSPKNWNDAMCSTNQEAWIDVLNKELLNLYSSEVAEETNLPKDKQAIDFSIRFKRKFDHQGNIIKNKVRICAQGFLQRHGVDYKNTYSPTGKFSSLRGMLTISAIKDLDINHMDVVAAFLNPKFKRRNLHEDPSIPT